MGHVSENDVFDRGYVDYQKYDQYCVEGTFFVTRLKDNAVCLIAYCLVLLMKLELKTTKTLLELSRLIKAHLNQSWEALRAAIFRRPSRTSKGRQKVAKA